MGALTALKIPRGSREAAIPKRWSAWGGVEGMAVLGPIVPSLDSNPFPLAEIPNPSPIGRSPLLPLPKGPPETPSPSILYLNYLS